MSSLVVYIKSTSTMLYFDDWWHQSLITPLYALLYYIHSSYRTLLEQEWGDNSLIWKILTEHKTIMLWKTIKCPWYNILCKVVCYIYTSCLQNTLCFVGLGQLELSHNTQGQSLLLTCTNDPSQAVWTRVHQVFFLPQQYSNTLQILKHS